MAISINLTFNLFNHGFSVILWVYRLLRRPSEITGCYPAPVSVIYETDFTFDVDDVGALAVLHALADNGEAEILAVSYNEVQSRAADAIDAINTWYGRGDIPIGLYDKPLTEPDYFHSFYIDSLAGMRNDITDNVVDSSLKCVRTSFIWAT